MCDYRDTDSCILVVDRTEYVIQTFFTPPPLIIYMNIKREGVYLTMLSGVALTSLGLLFILNSNSFATEDIGLQMFLMWFAIGVLYMWNGVFDLFDGAQGILEDVRKKREKKLEDTL